MTFKTLEEAVAELRKHPENAVRADSDGMVIELRAVSSHPPQQKLGQALAALGPWEGESEEELVARLRAARTAGGSAEPPVL